MAYILPFSVLKLKPTTICNCKATAAPPSAAAPSADALNQQFGRKGIKFVEDSNSVQLVELSVRNGSSLRLQIANAHLSSYKPKVHWKDDGFEEVLYTLLGGSSGSPRGGIGLVLDDVTEPISVKRSEPTSAKGSVLAGVEWSVKDVDSDSFDAVQVELSSKSRSLDITYVVSLYPESMSTAVIVKNTGRKSVKLRSAILSHIRFKNRGGSAIQGLQGCSYCAQPPLSSPFELVSPAEAMKTDDPDFFSFGSDDPPPKVGQWVPQDELITVLKKRFSRVYAAPPEQRSKAFYRTPPSKYETVDQGRGLAFRVIRMGYEDIYVSSPGTFSEKYGREYFICTGPASMLVPVTVNPGETWKGAQAIEHDNLT